MPAAVAVPLISSAIAGGTAIVGAKMATGANRDAAKMQTESADKALDLQKEMADRDAATEQARYEQGRSDLAQSRADLSPFRQLGAGAVGLLGEGLGINIAPEAPMSIGASAPRTSSPMSSLSAPSMMTPAAVKDTVNGMGIESAHDVKGRLGEVANTIAAAQQASASGYQAMRTPSGQIVNIPQHMIGEALKRGAQAVA